MRNGRLALISLLAMVCVVWWHCFCGSNIERWFVPSFCVWSVPWFFFLSGALFARSLRSRGVRDVLVGKIRSLAVPYLLWCVIGLVVSWPIIRCDGIVGVFAASYRLIHPVGNIALWYVRTLMVFAIIIGAIWPLAKRLGRWSDLACAFFFLFLVKCAVLLGLALGPGSSPFYFAAGFALSCFVLGEGHLIPASVRAFIFIGAIALAIATRAYWFNLGYDFGNNGGTVLGNVSTVFIIIGLWFGVGALPDRIVCLPMIVEASSLTAIVYFMHYPINDVIKHVADGFNRDVLFVVLVVTAPVFYLFVAFCIKKHLRLLYNALSGGR